MQKTGRASERCVGEEKSEPACLLASLQTASVARQLGAATARRANVESLPFTDTELLSSPGYLPPKTATRAAARKTKRRSQMSVFVPGSLRGDRNDKTIPPALRRPAQPPSSASSSVRRGAGAQHQRALLPGPRNLESRTDTCGVHARRPSFSPFGTEALPKAARSTGGWRPALSQSLGTWALGHDGLEDGRTRASARGSLLCAVPVHQLQAQRDAQPETKGFRRPRGCPAPLNHAALSERAPASVQNRALGHFASDWAPQKDLSPVDPVRDFQYMQSVEVFCDCLNDFKVQHKVVPYQLRHSGPSVDMARGALLGPRWSKGISGRQSLG